MTLRRASCQGKPLRESYREFSERGIDELHQVATKMLELLPFVEEICMPVDVWATTSHTMLCLLAADDFMSPCYVMISASSLVDGYDIRYIKPASETSWPDVAVKGYARSMVDASQMVKMYAQSLTDASQMVRAAMVSSRGWKDFL